MHLLPLSFCFLKGAVESGTAGVSFYLCDWWWIHYRCCSDKCCRVEATGQLTRDQPHRFFHCPQPFLSLCAALTPGRDYAEILYMHSENQDMELLSVLLSSNGDKLKYVFPMHVAEAQPNARLFSKTKGHISISIFLSASSIDIFLFITET